MELQSNNPPEQTEQNRSLARRPWPITAMCIWGFIGVPLALGGILIPSSRQLLINRYGFSFIPVTLLATTLTLTGLTGYWKMRKWGVYVYTTVSIISILYGLIVGISGILGYIIPLIIIALGFMNLKKMS